MNKAEFSEQFSDAILIGSGIMSSTLGVLLKQLAPDLNITVLEAADHLSPEASDGWHNAGTGHAGLCELSYTPDRHADGRVNVSKAIDVFQEFEMSLQFWAHGVEAGILKAPTTFINPVAHVSFVRSAEQVAFLRSRHEQLSAHHFFADMEFSDERDKISAWAPLLTEGRPAEPIAATRVAGGTDVDFGAIARQLLDWLDAQEGCEVCPACRVTNLQRTPTESWRATCHDRLRGSTRSVTAPFVFVGAGGGSLHLLQKADLPDAQGLGGFPVGGQWLVCDDPEIVEKHDAKVYGQALGAAPTMAVPHLDTRVIDGKRSLLFGPFASWTTKFLHEQGRWTDLPRSIKWHNLPSLLRVGAGNLDLIRYLMQQGTQSMADRMAALREFYPSAQPEDWRLEDAGIRVQAIKKSDGKAGIVHYGTEVLTSADNTMAALLGASPGASTSVQIVLDVIARCRPDLLVDGRQQNRLRQILPSYGVDLRTPESATQFSLWARATRKQLALPH